MTSQYGAPGGPVYHDRPASGLSPRGLLLGQVEDTYGRKFGVWRDVSGCVRLDLGSIEIMLDPSAWGEMEKLGAMAIDDAAAELAELKQGYPAPVPGKSAQVDRDSWLMFQHLRKQVDKFKALLANEESHLREQVGDAKYLMVGDVRVGTRAIRQVKGATWTQDYLRVNETLDEGTNAE